MHRPPPARRIILIMGSVIAVLNLAAWSASEYAANGKFVSTEGLLISLFILTAVLVLYVVLRVALFVLGEDAV